MELYQIYVAVNFALLVITWFFQWNDYGDIESKEESILDDLNIMGSALGTLGQMED